MYHGCNWLIGVFSRELLFCHRWLICVFSVPHICHFLICRSSCIWGQTFRAWGTWVQTFNFFMRSLNFQSIWAQIFKHRVAFLGLSIILSRRPSQICYSMWETQTKVCTCFYSSRRRWKGSGRWKGTEREGEVKHLSRLCVASLEGWGRWGDNDGILRLWKHGRRAVGTSEEA